MGVWKFAGVLSGQMYYLVFIKPRMEIPTDVQNEPVDYSQKRRKNSCTDSEHSDVPGTNITTEEVLQSAKGEVCVDVKADESENEMDNKSDDDISKYELLQKETILLSDRIVKHKKAGRRLEMNQVVKQELREQIIVRRLLKGLEPVDTKPSSPVKYEVGHSDILP